MLRERGYRAGGRRPRTASETGLIGVTMPLVHPGYFAQILSGAAEALYEHGIPVVCAAHSSGATQATEHLLSLGHPPQEALQLAQDASPSLP